MVSAPQLFLSRLEENSATVASYAYDSQNRRISKTVAGVTTHYIYDLNNQLIAETLADGTPLRDYFYLEGQPLAVREYQNNPGLYYFLNDHLGTPQQLVSPSGTVVWQAAYLPYGEAQVQTSTVANNLRFPGQYFDAETGLQYNWNRYYDPETGRYISADPIGLAGGLNLYAYVGGNPINYIDPDGLTGVGITPPETHHGEEHIHYGSEKNPRRDGAIDRRGNIRHKCDAPPNNRQLKLIEKLYPGWLLRGFYPLFLLPGQEQMLKNMQEGKPLECSDDCSKS